MNAASELPTLRDREWIQIHPVMLLGGGRARCAPTLLLSGFTEFSSSIIVVNEASQRGSIGEPAEASPKPHRVILAPFSCGTGPAPDGEAATRLRDEALWNSGDYSIYARTYLDGLRRHNSK